MFNKDRESYKTNTLLIAFTRKIQAVHNKVYFSQSREIYFLIGRRDLGSVSEYNEDVRASRLLRKLCQNTSERHKQNVTKHGNFTTILHSLSSLQGSV